MGNNEAVSINMYSCLNEFNEGSVHSIYDNITAICTVGDYKLPCRTEKHPATRQ